jgi:hypothetical protein
MNDNSKDEDLEKPQTKSAMLYKMWKRRLTQGLMGGAGKIGGPGREKEEDT